MLLDLRLQSKPTIFQKFVTRISEYSIAAVCHFALRKRSRSRYDVISQLNLHQSVFCVQNLNAVFKFLSVASRLSFLLAFSSFFSRGEPAHRQSLVIGLKIFRQTESESETDRDSLTHISPGLPVSFVIGQVD